MESNLLINQPYINCIYQRGIDGFASVPVAGNVAPGTANVLAVFTPVKGGTKLMQTLPVDKAGMFHSSVQVPGGWYSLTLSVGDVSATVNRVGSGEVFAIFGHSYLQGGHDVNHQLPATDERVITLLDTVDTQQNQFGQLTTKVGPFHGSPDAWGQLGDLLVSRLNVPVMLYGCAYGGSNLQMSLDVIDGVTDGLKPPGYAYLKQVRQPYLPLETVMNQYVPKTGIRGVLFEHGYNDRGKDKATFSAMLKRFFDTVRQRWNKPGLSFIMVQEQLTAVAGSLYDIPTAQAQQEVLQTYPNVFKGPDFNGPDWVGKFPPDHLFGSAIDLFAAQWNQSISQDFLFKSTPYGPELLSDVLPVALYNAPISEVKPVDWIILILAASALVGIFIYKSKKLSWAFLILGLIALARLNGKF